MYRDLVIATLQAAVSIYQVLHRGNLNFLFASSFVPATATFDRSLRYDFLACVDVEWWNYDSINLYF